MKSPANPPRRLGIGLLLFACLFAVSCGRDNKPPTSAAVPAIQKPHIAGADTYRLGLAALNAKDTDEALRLFRQATTENHEMAEAWYQCGHLLITLAPDIAKRDEPLALQMFREGLQSEQEALRLLEQGKVSVWTGEEEIQARTVMDVDLQGADEALTDRDALAEQLRQRIR